jgi:integrase
MPIKKLGNKKYNIRVSKYVNGFKKERKFTGIFLTMGDAKYKENELIAELEQVKFKEENEELRYTWLKAKNDYLDHSESIHRLSTYYSRMKVIEKHTSSLYETELHEITKSQMKEIIDSADCSISHKREILKYIRQVFELAIDNRKISINPCKNIIIHGDKNHREKANKLEAMTKDEVGRVLTYMQESGHPWFSIFFVTFHLGLRSSEAVALEFEDIVWEKNHIVINKSWSKKKNGFVPPKNGTSRIVPMNKQLKVFLRELSLENRGKGFVLPRIKSWINGGATKILQEFQKHLGIKQTNYHSLRASFITILLRSGLDVVSVQAMVGHKELKTTQRYIRLDATDLINATVALEFDEEEKGKVLTLKIES